MDRWRTVNIHTLKLPETLVHPQGSKAGPGSRHLFPFPQITVTDDSITLYFSFYITETRLMNNNYAPIALFVYNRPWHTQQTIEALLKNELASESDLVIFCDGPKNDSGRDKTDAVRKYVNSIRGFKNIEIYEHENNHGLANSIIAGVTRVVKTLRHNHRP